ncbi:MAG: hypothetical protein ACI9N9_002560 [Enterobacterales bacterium]|jgi:hypothetical protein
MYLKYGYLAINILCYCSNVKRQHIIPEQPLNASHNSEFIGCCSSGVPIECASQYLAELVIGEIL